MLFDDDTANVAFVHELAQLCDALRVARRAQAKAIAAASDEALRQMPAPLRSGIARLVGR